MKKLEIVKKVERQTCWGCGGKGCKVCKFTGVWKETHYIYIINGKYAIDCDTLK